MKGISLSMNTIVIIVLAILVLVAIMFFFTSGYGSGEQNILLKGQQTDLCGQYATMSLGCSDLSQSTEAIRASISDVCNRLEYTACDNPGDPAESACIMQCCAAFCGGGGGGGGVAAPNCEGVDPNKKECCEAGGECVHDCPADKLIGWGIAGGCIPPSPSSCCEK